MMIEEGSCEGVETMSEDAKWKNAEVEQLFSTFSLLRDKDECARFFEDLCSIQEILEMANRLQVAKMLDQKCSYQIITAQTRASATTIGRVNKSLVYGTGGYRLVLDRMKNRDGR